jgi:hypothetical protein
MDKSNRGHRGLRAEAEVPVNLEHVLLRAARDAKFRARLLADPSTAIREAEITLTASEGALLAAMSGRVMEAMIDGLAPRRQKNTRFLRQVGAAALAGGILVASCDGGNDAHKYGGMGPDTDVDSDSDADSDTDTDTDADAGPDGGE